MALREELEKQGNWLFRWRSYLPLVLLPMLLILLKDSEHVERLAGDRDLSDGFWEVCCLAISFLGLAVRCITVGCAAEGTSGRNTKRQKAETLNTAGMYSVVRHPLYLGNFIIILGMTLFVEVWWFTLIVVLAFWLYYERIIFAEEEFLRKTFADSYLKWAEQTPTFLPKCKNWKKVNLPFSFRTVLKREYSGFFAIIVYFTSMKVARALFSEGKLELDLAWATLFIIGLIIYLTLRTLKRKTKILNSQEKVKR